MHLEDTADLQISTSKSSTLTRDFRWIAILFVLLLGLLALEPNLWIFRLLRLLLGLFFALFAPGYTLHVALFPRTNDLEGPERVTLSFVLSLAVMMVLALILDHLPWGIHLWPFAALLGVTVLLFSLFGTRRRLAIPAGDCFLPSFEFGLPSWRDPSNRPVRIVYVLLAASVLIALFSSAMILFLPSPAENYTEFFVLNPQGLAENYPRQVTSTESVSVELGLVNHEQDAHIYQVQVWVEDPVEGRRQKVEQSDYEQLNPGEVLEWPLSWRMPWPGQDQKVEFLLFLDDHPNPYRTLRLFLNVED